MPDITVLQFQSDIEKFSSILKKKHTFIVYPEWSTRAFY